MPIQQARRVTRLVMLASGPAVLLELVKRELGELNDDLGGRVRAQLHAIPLATPDTRPSFFAAACIRPQYRMNGA